MRTIPAEAGYIFVFLFCLAIYNFLHSARLAADPDAFYHIKMAQLIQQQGLVRSFTWLPYTTLAHDFADQHLLYHLLLVPFIVAYGPFIGAIVATEVFASIAVVAFYAALRVHGARWAMLFALILATSYSFMVRVNLIKASSLSVTVVLLSLVAYRLKRPVWLFALSWVFVLLHAAWPLMIAIVAAYLAAGVVADRLSSRPPRGMPLQAKGKGDRRPDPRAAAAEPAWRRSLRRDETRLGLAALGGLVGGLVINPYFPANLRFYGEQIYQVAVRGYGDLIGVGLEWYPYPFADFFVRNTALINAFLLCGVLALVVWWGGRPLRRPSMPADRAEVVALVASLLLTVVFAVLTSRSRRHIEYLAPVGIFSAALLATWLMARLDEMALRERLRRLLPAPIARWLPLDTVIAVILLALAAIYGANNVVAVTNFFSTGGSFLTLERAAGWLKANTPPGAIVVQSNFEQFGPLFYANDHNRYICGLDPTFFYRQDPERYRIWQQLVTGAPTIAGKVAPLVRDGLGSRYLLVGPNEVALLRAATEDSGLTKVYEDSEARIFEVR